MLQWFRRLKKTEEQAPAEPAAPEQTESPAPPPEAADTAERTPAKRRRGTRGGRGRRKQGQQAETPERAAQAQPERERKQPERERKQPDRERKQPERKQAARQRPERRRRVQPKRAPLPQAKRELLVSVDVGEQRVAVLEDERVAEVYLERPERRSIAGNVYLGTVDNVLPGMEAAFVEIGLEKNGFLYVDEIVVPELEGRRHGKKIQDLLSRGQTLLVQAVKDPMKSKGARLTTEISLPGRFVVFVPQGEGLGVSRRLPDEERARLKDVIKALDVPEGGVIVRTAAEGASAEDVERDLVFLQRLWKTIQERAEKAQAPALVYQEAELPLRVVRDLFTEDFERAVVDHERTHKRIVGYLKKTSPHMVERVVRYKEKTPLFEGTGVDAEIRSTLSRRVDLPSGGYLVFDYAEAFTVIDVNTGRFVGSRSKSSGARLEDTITKNNLEAVKEVVRQLRLRDIGGIIVIDFIDMVNPKNRATVEEALRTELERDRTKTYVVEISPLGLVEMTRQNVTDGPREILTRKCPTCSGDGIVVSEASAAVEIERRLRVLASASRAQAFRIRLHPRVATLLIGPGASRLAEIEAQTKRRFFVETTANGHSAEHFEVLAQGKLEELQPARAVAEGQELEVKLVEMGLHDPEAGVGKVDGFDVCVGNAAPLIGKKVRVRIERVLDGSAYATWLDAPVPADPPITAEGEAEKPTRQPRARKAADAVDEAVSAEEPEDQPADAVPLDAEAGAEPRADAAVAEEAAADGAAKKRTRRGSRGGRGRKRKTAASGTAAEGASADGSGPADEVAASAEPAEAAVEVSAGDGDGATAPDAASGPRIHVPDESLGRDDEDDGEAGSEGDEAKPRSRTRRGTRGGRNRRRKPAGATEAAATGAGATAAEEDASATEAVAVATPEPESAIDVSPPEAAEPAPAAEAAGAAGEDSDWGYVPMSQWEDEI